MTKTKPPARCTEYEMKKVGVTLTQTDPSLWLQCDRCGSQWTPSMRPGGRLQRLLEMREGLQR